MRLRRTTGVLSGLVVVLLGAWAGLVPFVGPYFDFGFTPDQAWHYSSSRLWLCILPAAVVVVGGLMMIFASRRPTGALGGWLAIAGGAWLIVGPSLSLLWQTKVGIGSPLGGGHRHAIEWVGYFYGVGALIVGFAAFATGRFWSRPHLAEQAPPDRPEERRTAAPAAPPSAAPRRQAEPQPSAPREPATAPPVAAPPAGGRRDEERQAGAREPETSPDGAPGADEAASGSGPKPVGERSAAGPRTGEPEKVEREQDTQTNPARPVRARRREGGLVGRLLGRRSLSR